LHLAARASLDTLSGYPLFRDGRVTGQFAILINIAAGAEMGKQGFSFRSISVTLRIWTMVAAQKVKLYSSKLFDWV